MEKSSISENVDTESSKAESNLTMYSEEEVRDLLIKRHNRFTTTSILVNSILLEQDLKWFEENKK